MSESAKGPKFDKKRTQLHPEEGWTCPDCHTRHDYPHWEDHHQKEKLDKTFCGGFCKESDPQQEVDDTGLPKPLFCPKCGWSEDRLVILKAEKGEVIYV